MADLEEVEFKSPFEDGPYVTVACICTAALLEQDGVMSLIRIVDRIGMTAIGPDAPDEMPPLPQEFVIVVIVKSGGYRGRATLRIEAEAPSGLKEPPISNDFQLDGEERGQQFRFNVRTQFEQTGLYWWHVFLNDHFVTKIPLRIMYQRQSRPQSPG